MKLFMWGSKTLMAVAGSEQEAKHLILERVGCRKSVLKLLEEKPDVIELDAPRAYITYESVKYDPPRPLRLLTSQSVIR